MRHLCLPLTLECLLSPLSTVPEALWIMCLEEAGCQDCLPGNSTHTCTGMSRNYRRKKSEIKK